ncbi:MAG: hypothetical protein Q9191_004114 [Dirinaria sp. TL-2023a]
MVDSSPTRLSATAAPFVPNPQAQQPYLGLTVAYYKLLEAYGANNGAVPLSNCSQLPALHQPPARYESRVVTKRKNPAYSNANAHLYREMMFSQHEFYVPPISVARRPSVVLPDGDYIGYYFKPEPASIQPTTVQPEEPKSTSEIMSPSGDVDYCLQHPPPVGVLPLLPLDGPIYHQAKLKDDYRAPSTHAVASLSIPTNGLPSGFLPLLDAPKVGFGKSQQPAVTPYHAVAPKSTKETAVSRIEEPGLHGGEHGGHDQHRGNAIAKQRPANYIYPAIPRQLML